MGRLREGCGHRGRRNVVHLRGACRVARRTADAFLPDADHRGEYGEGIHLHPLDRRAVDRHRRPGREKLDHGFPLPDGRAPKRQDVLRTALGREQLPVHPAGRKRNHQVQVLRQFAANRLHARCGHGLPAGDRPRQLSYAHGRRVGNAQINEPRVVHVQFLDLRGSLGRASWCLHLLPHENRRQLHAGLRLRAGGERGRRHRPLRQRERCLPPEQDGDAARGRRRAAAGPLRPRAGRDAHVPLPAFCVRGGSHGGRGHALLREPGRRRVHALRRLRRGGLRGPQERLGQLRGGRDDRRRRDVLHLHAPRRAEGGRRLLPLLPRKDGRDALRRRACVPHLDRCAAGAPRLCARL